jgi:hypothetical protein
VSTWDKCIACGCPVCMTDRAEVRTWMEGVADKLITLVDRHRAEQLHSPAIRALADAQRQLQVLRQVVADHLDGKASREALAFTLHSTLGVP